MDITSQCLLSSSQEPSKCLFFFRLTIWTIVLITKVIDVIEVIDEAGNLRTITPTNIGWMLGIGWTFYLFSQLLNLVYYKMHPSSPELWTWGAEEVLEEWTQPEETQEQGKLEIFYVGFVKNSPFIDIDAGKNVLEKTKTREEDSESDFEITVL